ncbi:DMT family transporter [Parapedobacter koreensis]|uniref:Permease of the drug/metabolite transporter (DMT) superfamily n=1 Tax=Parapedobacter koreensis TaxID=332977 RepID=A0A1H7JD83_9SPHI|nr:DMT family transporter [Parapedobacter koreensis]SEK72563.1 Permease of the drug/metabolite transporter (DMT) superfamily [Parapedobacter koreensis]
MGSLTISRNLFILHLTVVVWGFTGILGNLISISAIHLVWYRVLIAFVSLACYFWFKRQSFAVGQKELMQFFFTGGLVGLHWVLFFESIKVSTVSVTLVCLSSITLFTAVIEPLFYRRRTSKMEVLVGLLIIVGIYLIFKFEGQYVKGIVLGLSAAMAAALFGTINSKLIKKNEATVISFYEMLGAWLWVSLFMLLSGGFHGGLKTTGSDVLYLLLLGIVCTSGAYVAAVSVMKEISAFRVALASNLEPIYGILLAWLFFGQSEKMSAGFYAGAIIILGTVFVYPVVRYQLAKRKSQREISPKA